jgi:ParB/RepB/Spo0J family partition protein
MTTFARTLSDQPKATNSHSDRALLAISQLKSCRYQIRDVAFENFDELENLANSIRTVGLLELPRVRKDPENPGCFEVISGHRRIHAVSKFLGWKQIECEICQDLDEFEVFRMNVTENMQRSNLSPYEEGIAFLLCEKLFGFSDEEIAIRLHKSRQMIGSKRELAVAANRYAKYADPSHANAFLRHFSSGHKQILSKLVDERIIRHSVTMIARGGSARNVQRFAQLFAEENLDQRESDARTVIEDRQRESSPIETVLSLFEELKAQVPREYVARINRIEDKYLSQSVEGNRLSEDFNHQGRTFKCVSCQKPYEISRKLVPEEDKVLFVINPKDSNFSTEKIVCPFPVFYKPGNALTTSPDNKD